MSKLQQTTLSAPNCETKIYLESDGQDLFLKINGWLTPELAKKLTDHIQQCMQNKIR